MDIQLLIDKIPFNPGIYMMKDINGNIMYVGKAKSLKKRVKQYFNNSPKSIRIQKMVEQIKDIEYITTANELEALVLECNYIKENKPKYNVLLKDDKMYPYLKITIRDKYPSIYITRKKIDDGSKYFGPYTDVHAIREVYDMLREIFPLKRCKYNLNKCSNKSIGPCLYYHIGRCLGPCINETIMQEYTNMMKQLVLFLEGKTSNVENEIKNEIDKCVEKLDFEKALVLKSRLDSIKAISAKQHVDGVENISMDVWGYKTIDKETYLKIFKLRNGKLLRHENLKFNTEDITSELLSVIARYYSDIQDIPNRIYIKYTEKDDESNLKTLENFLRDGANKNVNVIIPQKGEKLKLIQMIENNIQISYDIQQENTTQKLLQQLAQILHINEIKSIEAYDISNLKNEYIVGSMVRYETDGFAKEKYRKFRIKDINTQDDVHCMVEIIKRRFKHPEWEYPTVVAIDGGASQTNAVVDILKQLNINVVVIGMVKNNKHKTEAIYLPEEKSINLRSDNKMKGIYKLLTIIQDEVHRFSITYHRSLRDTVDNKKRK